MTCRSTVLVYPAHSTHKVPTPPYNTHTHTHTHTHTRLPPHSPSLPLPARQIIVSPPLLLTPPTPHPCAPRALVTPPFPPFPHPFSHPKRITALNESGEQRLRLFIEGGGCSGFSYKFELDGDEIDEDDDRVFGHAAYPAAEVVVDDSSYDLLKGCVVLQGGDDEQFVSGGQQSPGRGRVRLRDLLFDEGRVKERGKERGKTKR